MYSAIIPENDYKIVRFHVVCLHIPAGLKAAVDRSPDPGCEVVTSQ